MKVALAYPWHVLLHLVLVAMAARGMAPPETLLAELVIITFLATVSKSHHALAVTVRALNWMEDWRGQRRRAVCEWQKEVLSYERAIHNETDVDNSPFSTFASRCISGNQTRHWGGGSDMNVSRNTLSVTFFCGFVNKLVTHLKKKSHEWIECTIKGRFLHTSWGKQDLVDCSV